MKKTMVFLLASILALSLFVVGVTASIGPAYRMPSYSTVIINLANANGATANVNFHGGLYVTLVSDFLKPVTAYTLIKYTDNNHVECITSATSSNYYLDPSIRVNDAKFDYKALYTNGIDDQIMLVTSKDVNCTKGKMKAWHPADYLDAVCIGMPIPGRNTCTLTI